ncbi:MAG: Mur ligase family protein [Steroidobacteraceae bacterium]
MSTADQDARVPGTLPFEDSRRLTGANLFFSTTGAVLEVVADVVDDSLLDEWRSRVARARGRLGWERSATVARVHPPGASLAFAAPCDQLFVATEVNEWALCSALWMRDRSRWTFLEEALHRAALEDADDRHSVIPPVLEESAAFARFERLAAAEKRSHLQSLIAAATARDLPYVQDDTVLTLGAGAGGIDFPLESLPTVRDVPWATLHDIPTAIVTGSNGKTTTVRLLAACSRAHGWHVAYSSTDGVYFDGELVAAGDYSGPAGGRMALRERRAQAAILETARGGILRRGIAVSRAQVALVTNVSSDHFGEYGIYDLDGLADVKLSVAAVVAPGGLLVLNADDELLRVKIGGLVERYDRCPFLGWFALDADSGFLVEHRSRGGSTCGVRNGRLCLFHGGLEHDLGAVASMPLTVNGSAGYNIANLAGAALAAIAMGIPASVVASVYAHFGAKSSDNLGRLMRFDVDGVRVVLDYAHNADGLRGLLRVAEHLRGGVGRLGLLLGHAGNRRDAQIEELARVAAQFHPDLVVVKENEGHLRGRQEGEVPRIIRNTLLRAGMPEAALPLRMTEVDAARCALEWARPGDVVALLVHSAAARAEVLAMLEARQASGG